MRGVLCLHELVLYTHKTILFSYLLFLLHLNSLWRYELKNLCIKGYVNKGVNGIVNGNTISDVDILSYWNSDEKRAKNFYQYQNEVNNTNEEGEVEYKQEVEVEVEEEEEEKSIPEIIEFVNYYEDGSALYIGLNRSLPILPQFKEACQMILNYERKSQEKSNSIRLYDLNAEKLKASFESFCFVKMKFLYHYNHPLSLKGYPIRELNYVMYFTDIRDEKEINAEVQYVWERYHGSLKRLGNDKLSFKQSIINHLHRTDEFIQNYRGLVFLKGCYDIVRIIPYPFDEISTNEPGIFKKDERVVVQMDGPQLGNEGNKVVKFKVDDEIRYLDDSFLDLYTLFRNSQRWATNFHENNPFSHIVLDGLIKPEKLKLVTKEILAMIDEPKFHTPWRSIGDENQSKLGLSLTEYMGKNTRHLIETLKSNFFVSFLERVSKIKGLIPDPHDKGGGIHIIPKGGFLKVHTDFPFHTDLNLYRRVNVLLYLNEEEEGWNANSSTDWNANFDLYRRNDGEGKYGEDDFTLEKVKSIPVLFNRMVIFNTIENVSYHGHEDPFQPKVTQPPILRKSIALYYYTSDIDPGVSTREKSTNFVSFSPDKTRAKDKN